jgi:hypothetical protein
MRSLTFLLIVALLALAATAVVAYDAFRAEATPPAAVEFQQLVGGLGIGSELSLARCAAGFDSRLASACSHVSGPLPCGDVFCPCHSLSVFPLTPIPKTSQSRPAWELVWDEDLP